jgi:hypothetical protein
MGDYLQILVFIIIAVLLLWFGYTLFFRIGGLPAFSGRGSKRRIPKPRGIGNPGDPHTCPVCSAKLEEGELVKSLAFPSLNGGEDRFMHIRGCIYCLEGELSLNRVCPVCGNMLDKDEVLVCRLYERKHITRKRPHIHVIGCSCCKRI